MKSLLAALMFLVIGSQADASPRRRPNSASVCPPAPHIAFAYWVASSSPNLQGSRLCRSTVKGKNYTRLNITPVTGTYFRDRTVSPGQTYYYVATAVAVSGAESGYSNEVKATVPHP